MWAHASTCLRGHGNGDDDARDGNCDCDYADDGNCVCNDADDDGEMMLMMMMVMMMITNCRICVFLGACMQMLTWGS